MNDNSGERLENSTKVLLAITSFAKLGFGIFFVAGSVYYHTGPHNDALQNFCKSIGRTWDASWSYYYSEPIGDPFCTRDVIGGL